MENRVSWIDGIKGWACVIVMLGHCAVCILPNIYFGDSYQWHSQIERTIHGGLMSIFFNSTSMVCLFFFISGYLISLKESKSYIIKIAVGKYLKLVPMVAIGVIIPYVVMKCNWTYHLTLGENSYAMRYVQDYNNFVPFVWGRNGVLADIFIKSFIRNSKYNGTLWFIAPYLWGGMIAECIRCHIDSSKCRTLVYSILFILCIGMDGIDWRLPYLGFIFGGAAIQCIINKFYMIRVNRYISWICFVLGFYLLAPLEYVGIYSPLNVFNGCSLVIRFLGISLIVLAIISNESIKVIFNNKYARFLGEYSFGIYVMQWGIIISIGCMVTYITYVACNIPYLASAVLGIGAACGVTILLAVVFTHYIYNKYIVYVKAVL